VYVAIVKHGQFRPRLRSLQPIARLPSSPKNYWPMPPLGSCLPFGVRAAKPTARRAEQRNRGPDPRIPATGGSVLRWEGLPSLAGAEQLKRFEYESPMRGSVGDGPEGVLRTHVAEAESIFVGHSMGGSSPVSTSGVGKALGASTAAFTLATPHQGSYSAYWVAFGRLATPLRPGSPLLTRLEEGRSKASGVRFKLRGSRLRQLRCSQGLRRPEERFYRRGMWSMCLTWATSRCSSRPRCLPPSPSASWLP